MLLVAVILVWQGRSMGAIIPILTLFAMATVRLMPSIQQLASNYTKIRYNMVSIEPLYQDLKELEEYNIRFAEDRESTDHLEFENEIQINNVSYRYPQADVQALEKISLTIPKGKAVALVGTSGAGKTDRKSVV